MNMLTVEFFSEKNNKLNFLLYVLVTAGIAIRLFHFFYNRSLWMDEVYLSSSLLKMDFADLASQPLYYQQKAPIGFLWLVKLMVQWFGNSEFSLRLVPLISGIASIILFVPVSRFFLSKPACLMAMSILCLSPALIYHSVEIKQYATELLATILSLYLFISYRNSTDIKSILTWAICGAVLLWFSYAVVFILAGIGISLSFSYLFAKNKTSLLLRLTPFVVWLLSFLVNYLLFTHKHAESKWIAYWFRSYDNFMPFPPSSFSDLKWFFINIYRMMDYPLGLLWNFNTFSTSQSINIFLKMPFIPVLLLFAGFYAFIKKSKLITAVLCVPIVLTCIASGLELYPLTERFWVFIAPVFILAIANGFSSIYKKIGSKKMKMLLFLVVISPALIQSAFSILKPAHFYKHKKSFQREALLYIKQNYKKDDLVYIYWNNTPGYNLYKLMYPLNYKAVAGKDHRKSVSNYHDYYQKLNSDLKDFQGVKRIWLVYNNQFLTDIGDRIDEPAWYYKNGSPTQHLLQNFINIGKPVKRFAATDVTVYLFELKNN